MRRQDSCRDRRRNPHAKTRSPLCCLAPGKPPAFAPPCRLARGSSALRRTGRYLLLELETACRPPGEPRRYTNCGNAPSLATSWWCGRASTSEMLPREAAGRSAAHRVRARACHESEEKGPAHRGRGAMARSREIRELRMVSCHGSQLLLLAAAAVRAGPVCTARSRGQGQVAECGS